MPKVDDLVDMLKLEMAAISVWRDFALEYRKAGKTQGFLEILETATNEEAEDAYRNNETVDKEQVELIISESFFPAKPSCASR